MYLLSVKDLLSRHYKSGVSFYVILPKVECRLVQWEIQSLVYICLYIHLPSGFAVSLLKIPLILISIA